MKEHTTKSGNSSRLLKRAGVFGGGAVGAEAAHAEAAASDTLGEGLKQLVETAKRLSGMGAGQLKGFLFERIEVAKFNVDAARKGLDIRARLTADSPSGWNDPIVDIEVIQNGAVVQQVQAKASDDPHWLASAVSKLRYDETTRLVLDNKADRVNEIVSEGISVTGKLEQSGATSGGTTTAELARATEHTLSYALRQEAIQLAREATTTGVWAATAGAVLGGAVSVIRNRRAYAQGMIDRTQTAKHVLGEMVDSGTRSGLAAVLGTLIRHGAARAGMQTLSKGNVATAVAAGILDAGGIVREYSRGDINGDAAVERLGQSGCTTISGIYAGAAAGAVLGPVGAAVGSVAGFVLAAMVYQSCVDMFKEARLSGKQAEQVAALGYEAVKVMERQRQALKGELAELSNEQRAEVDGYFAAVELTLLTDQSRDTH